ncbi:hypothetical protein ABT369_26435 [Dactylosporangium sp. NPDC000244]|uniref:hypothetical protein n=1 Tax=Dactylosporangium sp. NPDC000244 TaxID=3154365 RepID=UPI0033349CE2
MRHAAPARTYLTAPALLLDLAQNLTATAADRHAGPDSCTILRRTTIHGDGSPGPTVTSVRVLHPDGSGLLLEQAHTNVTTASGWSRTTYPVGQLLAGFAEPLPDDPNVLAAAVLMATATSGSSSSMQVAVLADLASLRYLDQPHRRTVLRFLATLPSSTILGDGRTMRGEPTIGVRFDDGTPTSIDLWFTATTGRLVAIDLTDTGTGRSHTRTDLLHSARCHPADLAPAVTALTATAP